MMKPGYYWAQCGPTYRPKQYGDSWRIVQVIAGLHTAEFEPVADRGAQAAENADLATKLDAAYAELHELRICAGELPECQ